MDISQDSRRTTALTLGPCGSRLHSRAQGAWFLARCKILSLGLGVCLSLHGVARGVEGPSISVPSDTIITPEENYLLGPQDELKVVVEDHPEYSDQEVVVPPDGQIVLPTGYQTQVIGHTKQFVQDGYKRWLATHRLHSPRVSVGIRRMRPAGEGYVFVVGDVVAPGSIDILKGFKITNVLARVGNVKGRLDEAEAQLARHGLKQPIPVDLNMAVSHPMSAANIQVKAGDVLTVHVIDPGLVSVNGDVRTPGLYQMRKAPRPGVNEIRLTARLTDLLVVAGLGNSLPQTTSGPDGDNAKVQTVGLSTPGTGPANPGANNNHNSTDAADTTYTGFLIRKDAAGHEQRITLDVEGALKNHGSDADIPLQPGDFVTITAVPPFNVWVNGFVASPSKIKLSRGAGVIEAIAQAGGLTKPMEKISASILRSRQVIPIDLNNLAKNNPTLQEDDVLQFDEPNIIKVQINGQVNTPSGRDPLRLPAGARVLDAVAAAGGLNGGPDTVTVSVLRTLPNGRQTPLIIDPVSLIVRNDETQNAKLQDGDVITVAQVHKQLVYLSGQVNKQGSYELHPGEGLTELIADAGGVTDDAALTRVTLQRHGQEPQVIDAYSAVKGGQKLSIPLQDGDMVVVPKNENRVLVVEGVNRPGFVPMPEKKTLTLLDAVTTAGGPQYGAKTEQVLLLRQLPDGRVQQTVIPYADITKHGNFQANLPLQNGDVVAVPQGKISGGFVNKVGAAAGVFGLLRGFVGF